MKHYQCLALIFTALTATHSSAGDSDSRPNVLFVAIDDLNDWVSLFGGHPQAKTPNLDRFAREGAIVFQNAHCPGPVCGPSRSALLSGYMPHRSGVYGNSQNMLHSKLIQANPTLPEYFANHGYRTLSRGKIFHAHFGPGGQDRGQWAFQEWAKGSGGTPVDRSKVTSRNKNLIGGQKSSPSKFTRDGGSEFAFGPTKGGTEEMSDYKTAVWAAEKLQEPTEHPFFLAVGFSKPHLPFYVPQSFFDLYPLDEIELPPIRDDDLADILKPNGKPKFKPSDDYQWLKEKGQMKQCVQAYLAATSFADACVGRLLKGLESSPHAKNTIVVIWGDHGWHLGEKLRFRKATAWSESTRCPLLLRTPEMTERKDCSSLVNLIDLFPTLVDYCGLPEKQDLDGKSIVALLSDPSQSVHPFTTTIFGHENASITDLSHRYIRYNDGTEELYQFGTDPQEWNNLATKASPAIKEALARMRALVPKSFAEPIKASSKAFKKKSKGLDRNLLAPRVLIK